jgi:hypothetical protein
VICWWLLRRRHALSLQHLEREETKQPANTVNKELRFRRDGGRLGNKEEEEKGKYHKPQKCITMFVPLRLCATLSMLFFCVCAACRAPNKEELQIGSF